MMRRKPSGATASTKKNEDDFRDVEGGVEGEGLSPPSSTHGSRQFTRTRRKRKSSGGGLHSCLVRLRLLSDRSNKKIESSLTRGAKKRSLDRISFCVLFSGLACFCFISFGLYSVLSGSDGRRTAIILPPSKTSLIARNLVSSVRPEEDDEEIMPILIPEKEVEKTDHYGKKDPKKHHGKTGGTFHYPHNLDYKELREGEYVDFGDIDLKLLANDDAKRQIYIMVEDLQGDYRSLEQERDDDYDQYWAYDDDVERNPYKLFDDYDESMDGLCRRTSWHRLTLQNCNNMHELDLVRNTPRFVGDGAYREVFVTEQPYYDTVEEMILKELRWDLAMAYDDFEYIRMDALVTERLTSNKQVSDIYGYCGLSMLTEFFSYGDIEDDVVGFPHHKKDFNPLDDEEVKPYNNFTASQKLKLALNMVEPVAALHNFEDGVIVHDDIQLCQYLWTDETRTAVKLNDFNRAEIMLWDEEHGKYCKYKNGRGHGDWRAPEEYKDRPLDEKIDIWSLGNNMYSLLTGVYPFFNVEKDKNIQKLIKAGETAVIDPRYVDRSFAESKLVEVIERCFVYDPKKRADINELRDMLVQAIAEDEERSKEAAKAQREREKQRAAQKKRQAQPASEEEGGKQQERQAERQKHQAQAVSEDEGEQHERQPSKHSEKGGRDEHEERPKGDSENRR